MSAAGQSPLDTTGSARSGTDVAWDLPWRHGIFHGRFGWIETDGERCHRLRAFASLTGTPEAAGSTSWRAVGLSIASMMAGVAASGDAASGDIAELERHVQYLNSRIVKCVARVPIWSTISTSPAKHELATREGVANMSIIEFNRLVHHHRAQEGRAYHLPRPGRTAEDRHIYGIRTSVPDRRCVRRLTMLLPERETSTDRRKGCTHDR
jgi:hypothetical protein